MDVKKFTQLLCILQKFPQTNFKEKLFTYLEGRPEMAETEEQQDPQQERDEALKQSDEQQETDMENSSNQVTETSAAQFMTNDFLTSDASSIKEQTELLVDSPAFTQLDEMQIMQILNHISQFPETKQEGLDKMTTKFIALSDTLFIPPNAITFIVNNYENQDSIKTFLSSLPTHEKAILLTTLGFPKEHKKQLAVNVLESIVKNEIYPLTLQRALPYLAQNHTEEMKSIIAGNMEKMNMPLIQTLIQNSPENLKESIKENLDKNEKLKSNLVGSYFENHDTYKLENNNIIFTIPEGGMERSFKFSPKFMDKFIDQVMGAAIDKKPIDEIVALQPLQYLSEIYGGMNEDGTLTDPNFEGITWKQDTSDEAFIASNKALMEEVKTIENDIVIAQEAAKKAQQEQVSQTETGEGLDLYGSITDAKDAVVDTAGNIVNAVTGDIPTIGGGVGVEPGEGGTETAPEKTNTQAETQTRIYNTLNTPDATITIHTEDPENPYMLYTINNAEYKITNTENQITISFKDASETIDITDQNDEQLRKDIMEAIPKIASEGVVNEVNQETDAVSASTGSKKVEGGAQIVEDLPEEESKLEIKTWDDFSEETHQQFIQIESSAREENFEKALEEINSFIEANEGYLDAYLFKGNILQQLNKHKEAINTFNIISGKVKPGEWNSQQEYIDRNIKESEEALAKQSAEQLTQTAGAVAEKAGSTAAAVGNRITSTLGFGAGPGAAPTAPTEEPTEEPKEKPAEKAPEKTAESQTETPTEQADENTPEIAEGVHYSLKDSGIYVTYLSENTEINEKANVALKENILKIKEAMKTAQDASDVIDAIQGIETELWKALGANLKFAQFEFKLGNDKEGNPITIKWESREKRFKATDFLERIRIMDKVLQVKEAELSPKAYEKFAAQTETARIELRDSWEVEARKREMQNKIRSYIDGDRPDYQSHPSIAEWDEDEIRSNWEKLQGNARVEALMKQSPFGVRTADVPAKAGDIIGTVVQDNYFDIDHVFEAMFNDDADETVEEIEELMEKEQATKDEMLRLQELYNKMEQTILLSEALRDLRFVEDDTEAVPQSQEQIEANETNDQIAAKLDPLFDFSNFEEGGAWDDFLHWVSGSGDASELTMNREGAEADYAYEGYFQANYNPEAAMALMANDRQNGLYTVENGVTKMDPAKVTEQVNRMIKIGYAQTAMMKNKSIDNINQALQGANPPTIENIMSANFTEEQMEYFQMGFVVAQMTDADKLLASAEEDIENEILNDPNQPALSKILSDLYKENPEVGPYLPKIKEKMLAAGGIMVTVENGEPRVSGGGIGTSFEVAEGVSFQIGGAITEKGGDLGIGLTFRLYDGENLDVSMSQGIALSGFGVGISAELSDPETLAKINASLGAGVSWAGIPVVGGSLGIDINRQAILNNEINEAHTETADFHATWDEWKNLKTVEEKYAALENQAPNIQEFAQYLESSYGLEQGDVVHVIEQMEAQITAEVIENYNYPILAPTGVGVAVVNGIPIPFIKISLGTVTAFVPHRKELAEIQSEHAVMEQAMELRIQGALETYEKTKDVQTYLFEESTNGELMYDQNGDVMVGTKSDSVDLAGIPTTSIEDYNEALAEAEVSLKEVPGPNGIMRHELQVHNLNRGKDVEMYIDPALESLGVIKDGNKLIIDGNINNLIIDRKRYKLPFKQNAANASMRDIITIRQKSSVQGGRDTKWMMNRGKGKMVRWSDSESKDGFDPPMHMMNVDNFGEQDNMFELDGYAENDDNYARIMRPHGVDVNTIDSIHAARNSMPKDFDENTIIEFDAIFENYDENIADKTIEDNDIREGFFDEMKALIDDPSFRQKLNETPDNVEMIVREGIIAKYPDASLAEINNGVTFILTEYFTNILDVKDAPKIITKRIENVFKVALRNAITDEVFNRTPGAAEAFPGGATEMIDYLMDEMYGDLLTKLESGATWDQLTLDEQNKLGAGKIFHSASRYYEGGIQDKENRRYRMTEAIFHGEQMTDPAYMGMEQGLGFITESVDKWDLNSSDEKNKAIAHMLLELTSPIPAENSEFLQSPLALKMLSTKPLLFATGMYIGTDHLNNVLTAMQNPEQINDSNIAESVEAYKEFVTLIREVQISGEPLKIKVGDITIELSVATEIVSGAYTKCANASWYTDEVITVRAYHDYENVQVISEFGEHQEIVESEVTKKFVDFAFGVGIEVEDTPGKRPDESRVEGSTAKSGEKIQKTVTSTDDIFNQ